MINSREIEKGEIEKCMYVEGKENSYYALGIKKNETTSKQKFNMLIFYIIKLFNFIHI